MIEPSSPPRRYPGWYYFLLVLIPVILIITLEAGLRIFNYGINTDQWIEVSKDKLILNPDIAHRWFFSTESIPYPTRDIFDKQKDSTTFRVFVLGGSSTAGFPFSPNGTFSQYIKKRLRLLYPENKIEVVNLSMAAINSYALRDLFPGILEAEPDVIIIYAGHNEYYGALGAGSAESLGNSRFMVNLVLSLNKFKTVELLRDIIKTVLTLFSSEEKRGGTLMARMAEDQLIEYGSDKYYQGISQFDGNLTDILMMAEEAKVPVLIGTLTSNLKDQKPFISIKNTPYLAAERIFEQAEAELSKGNKKSTDSLFRYAKDLDALRFRAPEKINEIIVDLSRKFKGHVIQIDSVFNALSPDGIVGNNLMTDHLHPTLYGYQLMGRLFFETMVKIGLSPKGKALDISDKEQDSITIHNFDFSRLDSTISDYRIRLLKSDWPFARSSESLRERVKKIDTFTYTDSLAALVVTDQIGWERAHRDLALRCYDQGDIEGFLREMSVLIDQFPHIINYYKMISKNLILAHKFKAAQPYLRQSHEIEPDFFSAKWLGIITLSENLVDEAIKYLEISVKYKSDDTQTLFNLAGAYSLKKEYDKALAIVNECLRFDPHYAAASGLQRQLVNIKAGTRSKK